MRDTVAAETPASRATSLSVTELRGRGPRLPRTLGGTDFEFIASFQSASLQEGGQCHDQREAGEISLIGLHDLQLGTLRPFFWRKSIRDGQFCNRFQRCWPVCS